MNGSRLVECGSCKGVFAEGLPYCPFCGKRNLTGLGAIAKGWHWAKEYFGFADIAPRNLNALSEEVEKKIAATSANREQVLRQFRGICGSLDLDKVLGDLRSVFLKTGGGNLNELLLNLQDSPGYDLRRFQEMTTIEFLMSLEDLDTRLSELLRLIAGLRIIVEQSPEFGVFHPKARFFHPLDQAERVIRGLLENQPRLESFDSVFKSLFRANEVLHRKVREYAMLRHAIRIEFWKSEGSKIRYLMTADKTAAANLGPVFEKAVSDGQRLAHLLREDCTGQTGEDPLALQAVISEQLALLEKWRLVAFSSAALGVVDGVRAINGGGEILPAETSGALGQPALPDPAVVLHATFTRFQEEEVRLAGECRVAGGFSEVPPPPRQA